MDHFKSVNNDQIDLISLSNNEKLMIVNALSFFNAVYDKNNCLEEVVSEWKYVADSTDLKAMDDLATDIARTFP